MWTDGRVLSTVLQDKPTIMGDLYDEHGVASCIRATPRASTLLMLCRNRCQTASSGAAMATILTPAIITRR
jgi:hypothetical protein